MLKVFSDRSLVPSSADSVVMLYPWWGHLPEDRRDPNAGRFDRYMEIGRRLFCLTSLEDADLAVLPVDWGECRRSAEVRRRAKAFVEHVHRAGKLTLIFFNNDSEEPIPLTPIVVFRTSLSRSRKKPCEFALPAWSEDFVAKHLGGHLPLRPKRERPVVGFCGRVPSLTSVPLALRQPVSRIFQKGKRLLKGVLEQRSVGTFVRRRALQVLAQSPAVETNFVVHEQFFGGAVLPSGLMDHAKMAGARQAYLQNMVDSDYILCTRGAGNFSLRLYETLSCGRIPVFLDTDCVLPYEGKINWKEYVVWVEEGEIAQLADTVAAFHHRLSERGFTELQRECRRLWERYLSPEGFFSHLSREALRP